MQPPLPQLRQLLPPPPNLSLLLSPICQLLPPPPNIGLLLPPLIEPVVGLGHWLTQRGRGRRFW
jgi:hypothetical protein